MQVILLYTLYNISLPHTHTHTLTHTHMCTGQLALILAVSVLRALALYDNSDDVFELTTDNFDTMVINSHYVWVVEFYAPW